MDILIYIGTAFAVAGLVGLGYCIRKAVALRREAQGGGDVTSRLQGLAGLNMAALGVAAIGLAMVVVGIVL